MKQVGIGTVLGVGLGIVIAEWFDLQHDQAYYAVIAIVAIVFGAISTLFARKAPPKKDK